MKKEISIKKGMKAIGPYSQAIRFGNLVFCSGNIGVNASGNLVEGVKEQTRQAINNIKDVLIEGGSSIENVLKTTVFLKDMNDFSVMNEVYGDYFIKPYPARSTVQVARLPKDALVEIECIAFSAEEEDVCCGGECCGGGR